MNKNKQFRGILLIELVIAVALFAIGMVTMSMMYYAFLSGNRVNSYRPQADRLGIEVLARELDKDFQTYHPILAYDGEVRDASSSWINVGPILLNAGVKPYMIQQEKFIGTQTPLTLVSNEGRTDRQASTLIFIGSRSGPSEADPTRYYVNAEVIYQLFMMNDVKGGEDGLLYQVTRYQMGSGATHQAFFRSAGYSLAIPDQQSRFLYKGDGQILAVLPNPFKNAVNPLTSTPYFKPLILEYNLTTTNLYVSP